MTTTPLELLWKFPVFLYAYFVLRGLTVFLEAPLPGDDEKTKNVTICPRKCLR